MRIPVAALCLVSTLATGAAFAQPSPFNEAGVTMGHWHFTSHDVKLDEPYRKNPLTGSAITYITDPWGHPAGTG